MRLLLTACAVLTLATSGLAQSLNTSREYLLHTQLKENQVGKERFNDLWLFATHTGAGLNDAVFDSNKSIAIKGFTSATNLTMADGSFYQYQEFDFDTTYPYGLSVADVNFYSGWEPVRINTGYGDDGFYFNSTGLQWFPYPGEDNVSEFGGWLVCDWWHGVPQLFAKWSYYDYKNPSSCADVYLLPEYI